MEWNFINECLLWLENRNSITRKKIWHSYILAQNIHEQLFFFNFVPHVERIYIFIYAVLSVFLGSCIYAGTIPIAFWRTAYKWFLVNIYYNIKKELYERIQSIDVDLKFLYLVQNFHVSLFIVYSVNPRVNLIRKQLPFSTHNQ